MGRSGWQNCKLMILVTCILTQTHYSLFRHVTYHSTVAHATSNLGQNCLQVLPAVTTLAAVILRVQVKLWNLKNEGMFTLTSMQMRASLFQTFCTVAGNTNVINRSGYPSRSHVHYSFGSSYLILSRQLPCTTTSYHWHPTCLDTWYIGLYIIFVLLFIFGFLIWFFLDNFHVLLLHTIGTLHDWIHDI